MRRKNLGSLQKFMLTIGIDGYEANVNQRVGVGVFAYEIIKALYDIKQEYNYQIYLPTPPLPDLPPAKPNWKYVVGKSWPLWTVWQLPFLIKQYKPQVFFSPTHYAPWFTAVPHATAVMDLSYLHYPELFRMRDLLKLKYLGKYSILKADAIFTISHFSKDEIAKYYKYPQRKVTITYPGLTQRLYSKTNTVATLNKHRIENKYFLFVGTIQPRKNIIRLIEAYELMDTTAKLIIVGKRGWLHEPIFRKMENSRKNKQINFIEFIDDNELSVLYANAICLVLPSLYEGFGMPVIEAMAMECPVVVSQTSSLPEVAGKCGIFVDPFDTEDIARGMSDAIKLTHGERQSLADCGKKQIRKYSWSRSAETILKTLVSLKYERSDG